MSSGVIWPEQRLLRGLRPDGAGEIRRLRGRWQHLRQRQAIRADASMNRRGCSRPTRPSSERGDRQAAPKASLKAALFVARREERDPLPGRVRVGARPRTRRSTRRRTSPSRSWPCASRGTGIAVIRVAECRGHHDRWPIRYGGWSWRCGPAFMLLTVCRNPSVGAEGGVTWRARCRSMNQLVGGQAWPGSRSPPFCQRRPAGQAPRLAQKSCPPEPPRSPKPQRSPLGQRLGASCKEGVETGRHRQALLGEPILADIQV